MLVAILQARVGSTRLPGKILKKILGRSVLEQEIRRVQKSRKIGEIVIATTQNRADDAVARLARNLKAKFFRGSENDVLDRYYQAAKKFGAKHIVRLTGDCPLIDPAVIDKVAGVYLKNKNKFDYVSNVHPPTYPDGMDVEIFSFKSLQTAWRRARLLSEREHVTPYIWKHKNLFRRANVRNRHNLSHLRLTVDEPADLKLTRLIFAKLYPAKPNFSLADVVKFLETNPAALKLNRRIRRNEGYAKSVKEDEKKR